LLLSQIPTNIRNPDGTSIGSAVLAQPTLTTNQQTHGENTDRAITVTTGRVNAIRTAMRPNNAAENVTSAGWQVTFNFISDNQ